MLNGCSSKAIGEMRSEDRKTNRHFAGVAVVSLLRSSDAFLEVLRTEIVTVKGPI